MTATRNEQPAEAAPQTPDSESKPAASTPVPGSGPGGTAPRRNPVRRWALIVLAICAVLLLYNLTADRLTPYTSQAYVQTFVVDIAPEVSGPVVAVEVGDNQDVKAGQELFRIDPARFDLAVASAEAELAQAGQSVGSFMSKLASAQANLSTARTNLDNARKQAARVEKLAKRGAAAIAMQDETQRAASAARSEVERAAADLEAAKQELGPLGAGNPQIRAATAALERAQLDRARTTVLAPGDGLITNLKLSVGQYATAGTPAMTFIDTREIWVVAELRERSLGNVQPGNRAEITFDVLPGQVFAGRVQSIGWGVSLSAGRGQTGLQSINEEKGWLRGAQLFPVRLTLDEPLPPDSVRVGSLGAAVVYSGDHTVMNAVATLLIRSVAALGYAF